MAKQANAEVVTVHKAKTHLSKLLARVEAGEEIVIARGKKPVVRMVVELPEGQPGPRVAGGWEGLIDIGPAFFEPLPDEELRAWGEIE